MDKVVYNGLKIDLHIHSLKSKFKDGLTVEKNTIKSIGTLIQKLNEHSVNICAISDHDAFDYDLYRELKKQEGIGSIKKVFPAVEFTVSFSSDLDKPVHIVSVFNDIDENKVKNIENVLSFDSVTNRPQYNNIDTFSENRFIELLGLIDLDVVCIAHQKKSLSSDTQPAKNDANSLGEDKFNEFLFSEYFEAFEFKNRKNQAFNNYKKSELNDDLLRFITGSDCHEWTAYPKYSSKSKNEYFKHTILKCLPSFRGLALSLTDDSRISLDDNFFNTTGFYVDNIIMSVKGEDKTIPMSKGINVIIGDNSIGKSLLLHKITDYYRMDNLSPLTETIKKGYEGYLIQNQIEIVTKIQQNNILQFDTQGEIRKKFNLGKLKDDAFFKDKYPPDLNTTQVRSAIIGEIDKVSRYFTSLFEYKQKYNELPSVGLLKEKEDATSITVINCNPKQYSKDQTRVKGVLSQLSNVKAELNKLKLLLTQVEQEEIDKQIAYLDELESNYNAVKTEITTNISILNCINTAFEQYTTSKTAIKTTADENLQTYLQKVALFSDSLVDLLQIHKNEGKLNPHIEKIKLVDDPWDYLNYTFIKRPMVQVYDDNYLKNLLVHPFDKKKKVMLDKIDTIEYFKESLKGYNEEDPIAFYTARVIEQLDKDLTQKPVINKVDEKGNAVVYSAGLNSQIYFEILSSDRYKEGIYLIDQPEDDVSPKSIKKHLLSNFKSMSRNRQIILVTHNPQFVVNLDADNVIILTKDNEDIVVESGALEYQDENTKILENVATLLDGGIETIRKRWKRYVKSN